MIPNLANASTSNKDLYLKKKKKKKKDRNRLRFSIKPDLANASTSKKEKEKKEKEKQSSTLSGAERAKALAKKRIAAAKAAGKTQQQMQEEQDTARKDFLKQRHADWKKMRSGDMSKEAFIKKYPGSQTAKESSTSPTKTRNKTSTSKNKDRVKVNKPLTKRQFTKKFGIEKSDSEWKKFRKSGALSGFLNRRLRRLKNMSKEELKIRKKKKK